jgi:hypothetical protein
MITKNFVIAYLFFITYFPSKDTWLFDAVKKSFLFKQYVNKAFVFDQKSVTLGFHSGK